MNDQALKDLLGSLSQLLSLVSQVATSGFSFSEVGTIVNLLSSVPVLAQEAPALLAQYKGLDDADRADLVAYVQANVQFPANTNVQLVIDKVLDVAVELSSVFGLLSKKHEAK
jgi:hypothetical protein